MIGLDEQEKACAKLVSQILVDTLAPTNGLVSNPTVPKRLVDTGGGSLWSGVKNYIDDLVSNGGMPSQVDATPFVLGKNIATTPGAVVFRNEILELIQYNAMTAEVWWRPLVITPPQVNNYLLGNGPQAFDILFWNHDITSLPARLHSDFLDLITVNPFRNPGALSIAGTQIDMRRVGVDAYVSAGVTDHITPWKSVYQTARILGDETTFVLSNAGHLQSLLNPPGNPKATFTMGSASAPDPDAFSATAQKNRQLVDALERKAFDAIRGEGRRARPLGERRISSRDAGSWQVCFP